MNYKLMMILIPAVCGACVPSQGRSREVAAAPLSTSPLPTRVQRLLDESRARAGLPGMAIAVWQDDRIVAEAGSGVRALGAAEPIRADDPFVIGSITKSFTSTIVARLVERGRLSWDATVGELLGSAVPEMQEDYRSVTLGELLAHRGGILELPSPEHLRSISQITGLREQRLALARMALSRPPIARPRQSVRYSSVGYVMAGVILEQVTGKSWEELARREIFAPLRLSNIGFAAPGRAGALDAPRGHIGQEVTSLRPVEPGDPRADNPAVIAPAGRMHASMRSLALFGADHVRGRRGRRGTLLTRGTYEKLHARQLGMEAMGWAVEREGEISHNGSNRRWYALLRVLPAKNIVVAVAANALADEAVTEEAVLELSNKVIAAASSDLAGRHAP